MKRKAIETLSIPKRQDNLTHGTQSDRFPNDRLEWSIVAILVGFATLTTVLLYSYFSTTP